MSTGGRVDRSMVHSRTRQVRSGAFQGALEFVWLHSVLPVGAGCVVRVHSPGALGIVRCVLPCALVVVRVRSVHSLRVGSVAFPCAL